MMIEMVGVFEGCVAEVSLGKSRYCFIHMQQEIKQIDIGQIDCKWLCIDMCSDNYLYILPAILVLGRKNVHPKGVFLLLSFFVVSFRPTCVDLKLNFMSSILKVALIDEHPQMREDLFKCLTLWGYSVTLQASGVIDFLKQVTDINLPDICILNIPELYAWEHITILKKIWPRMKIIVLSGNSIIKSISKMAGADAVVSRLDILKIKPVLQELNLPVVLPNS